MKIKSNKQRMRSFVYGTLCLGSSHLAVMATAETQSQNEPSSIADTVESMSTNELKIEKYIPHFRGVEIEEFVTSIGKTLDLTMIIDPAVRGKVNTRSSQSLTAKEYYQFFLNTLEVYGFAAIKTGSIVKIMRSKDARTSAIPVGNRVTPGVGDEFVTQIVPLYNVEAGKLAPKLRQLNSSSRGGNVVNYDDSNVLILTGRAAVVEKLIKIIRMVDKQGDSAVEVVPLRYAAANDIVKIVTTLNKRTQKTSVNGALKVVADERTNSIIVTGNEKVRLKTINLIRRLDFDQKNQGNVRVRYLKYATAEDLVDVLNGFSKTLTDKAKKGGSKNKNSVNKGKVSVVADKATNALVITAQPDEMSSLNKVIDRLDIRPLQVLIEAIIVEVSETDNEAFSLNGFNLKQGVGFAYPGAPVAALAGVAWASTEQAKLEAMATYANKSNPLTFAFSKNDWLGIIEASITSTNNNVLATPQIFTVDNQEARVFVGQEVSVETSSTVSATTGTTNSKERKSVGTELKVTPHVIDENTVRLTILQNVDSIDASAAAANTFKKRELTTTVVVASGSIIPLGGLIRETMKETEYKVPLLGDIPLIGRLFRRTDSSQDKTNLMIFIRPTIVSDDDNMREMAGRKYNYMRFMELNSKDNGIQPIYHVDEDSQATMQAWESQSFVPDQVKKVVDYYEHRDILNQIPASQFIQLQSPASPEASPMPPSPQPVAVPSVDAQPKASGVNVVPVPMPAQAPPVSTPPVPVIPSPSVPASDTAPMTSPQPATAPKATTPRVEEPAPAATAPVVEPSLVDEPLPSDLDLIEAMNELELPAAEEEAVPRDSSR
jgi:general secretion pathway protein D